MQSVGRVRVTKHDHQRSVEELGAVNLYLVCICIPRELSAISFEVKNVQTFTLISSLTTYLGQLRC